MKAATVWKNAENSDKLGKEKAKMADSSIPVVQASEKVLQKPEKSEKQQQPQQQQQQQNVSNPWAQLDQLLTCAICLDRYRNPKLLPCQHTFCMEPCLDGLIDPIRRLIKCPECRAEHYVPYNGVQSYSTNLTLMRFLELHFLATGEEPEPQYLYQKCAVCEDKTEVFKCAHCDKNVCKDCKDAHADLLKREITRIMNQVRRGIARVSEAVSSIKKNSAQLQHNCESVKEEVENTMRRFTKELKDREAILLNEIDLFMQTELRCMRHLQENLEVEIRTVNTMCEEAESYMTDNTNLDDNELMNFKEQFIQSLEFLRNFNPDSDEFTKRLRFSLGSEPELLHQYISQFGELHVNSTHFNRHMSSAERMATKYLSDKQYDVLLGLRRESHHLEPGDTARRGYISDSEALSPRHSPRPLRREIENLRDSGSSYFRRPESPQDRYSGSSYLTKSYESLRNADFEAPGSSFSRRYGDYNSGYSSSRDRDVESTPGFSGTTRTLDRGGTTSDYENDSYSSIRSRLSRARGETSSDATVTSGSSASTRVADPPLRTWKSRQDLLESGNVNTAENAPVRSAHRAYTIDVSAIQDSNLRESDNESRTRLRSRQNSVEASSIEANRPTRWSVDNSNSGQITNTAESTRAARKSIGSRQSSIDSTINPVDQTRLTKTAENVSSESTRSWRRPRDSVQDATDSAPEQPTRSWRRHLGNQSDNETSSSTISGSEALKRWRRRAESQPDLTETISESRRSSRVEPEDSAESRLSRKDQTDLARRAGSSACEQAISRRRFKRYGDTRHKSDTRYDQPVTPETSKYSSDKEDFVVSYRSRRRSRSASRPSSQERDDDSTYESGALTRPPSDYRLTYTDDFLRWLVESLRNLHFPDRYVQGVVALVTAWPNAVEVFYGNDLAEGVHRPKAALVIAKNVTREVAAQLGLYCLSGNIQDEMQCGDVLMVCDPLINGLEDDFTFEYLGIDESSSNTVFDVIQSDYLEKLNDIWITQLPARNKVQSTNSLLLKLIYTLMVLRWSQDEFRSSDLERWEKISSGRTHLPSDSADATTDIVPPSRIIARTIRTSAESPKDSVSTVITATSTVPLPKITVVSPSPTPLSLANHPDKNDSDSEYDDAMEDVDKDELEVKVAELSGMPSQNLAANKNTPLIENPNYFPNSSVLSKQYISNLSNTTKGKDIVSSQNDESNLLKLDDEQDRDSISKDDDDDEIEADDEEEEDDQEKDESTSDLKTSTKSEDLIESESDLCSDDDNIETNKSLKPKIGIQVETLEDDEENIEKLEPLVIVEENESVEAVSIIHQRTAIPKNEVVDVEQNVNTSKQNGENLFIESNLEETDVQASALIKVPNFEPSNIQPNDVKAKNIDKNFVYNYTVHMPSEIQFETVDFETLDSSDGFLKDMEVVDTESVRYFRIEGRSDSKEAEKKSKNFQSELEIEQKEHLKEIDNTNHFDAAANFDSNQKMDFFLKKNFDLSSSYNDKDSEEKCFVCGLKIESTIPSNEHADDKLLACTEGYIESLELMSTECKVSMCTTCKFGQKSLDCLHSDSGEDCSNSIDNEAMKFFIMGLYIFSIFLGAWVHLVWTLVTRQISE